MASIDLLKKIAACAAECFDSGLLTEMKFNRGLLLSGPT